MITSKKSLIALSAVAALSINSFAADGVEAKLEAMEAKIKKLEKQLSKAKKSISEVKIQANNDNIKFDVDFRTAMDSIHYKHSTGAESSNPDLLTNRLWLNMGYAPSDNVIFKGTLSYFKAYGDSANHSQANVATSTVTNPTTGATSDMNYNYFDWVTNENANDNTIKVKEAYWLYMNDTLAGSDVPWTVSVGRRPSTDGLGINMREGQKDKSPLSHTVNVEFDGASAKFTLSKVTGVDGMWFKLCTGRGLTNAKPRFTSNGDNYAYDSSIDNQDNNMYGFIFVPWDNGQYSIHTNWAKAEHMIGFNSATTYKSMGLANATITAMGLNTADIDYQFHDVGDINLFTAMFKAEGIGDGISDFLDDTRFFISWAQSETDPNGKNGGMLGSTDSKTGNSTWIGLNMPCPLTENGRIGIEYNKGSKYWRSVTYGEDTMAGSKIAARGDAFEVYYQKPLTKALFFDVRYTDITYDYTGSNGFFGNDGMPMSWSDVTAYQTNYGMTADPVKEATDLRASISYRY